MATLSAPEPVAAPVLPVAKHKREIFPALDGVRVVLTLWVVTFHVLWHLAMFVTDTDFIQTYHIDTNRVLSGGLNGVDYFFVLTGFLVAYPIFTGRRTGTWFEFVWMRITRIYPVLITCVAVFCIGLHNFGRDPYISWEQHPIQALRSAIEEAQGPSLGIPNNCNLSWANLLFINNFLPFGGCMGWTWSLCIQVHFMVIFPLVIRWFGTGKKFLYFCAACSVVWMVFRSFVFLYIIQPSGQPPMYVYYPEQIGHFFLAFNLWYCPTPQRIATIFAGAIMAWVQANKPQRIVSVVSNPIINTFLTIACFVALWFSFDVDFTAWIQPIVFAVGGPGHAFAICFLLYSLINKWGPMALLSNFLSHPILRKLAYPTYAVYLSHCFWTVLLYRSELLGELIPYTHTKHAIASLAVIVVSWTFGYLVTRFIEEPIKELLRRYVDPTPSKDDVKPVEQQRPAVAIAEASDVSSSHNTVSKRL